MSIPITSLRSALIAALLVGCSTTTPETLLRETQVPAAVLTAFCKQFPGARVLKYALEKKGTREFYELETDGKGAPQSLIYTPAGELAETEIPIPFAQLPAAVQEGVRRTLPTRNIDLVEMAQNKGKTFYEIHFKEDGRAWEAKFDSTGNLLEKKHE